MGIPGGVVNPSPSGEPRPAPFAGARDRFREVYETHYPFARRRRRPLPITSDRIARLRGFGLSEYAARAYLALLDLGTCEARDVSSLSKVPASKIYHILEQLHDKGLVVVLPEFPRQYAPVPFAEFLHRMRQEHEEAAERLAREHDELTAAFSVQGDVSGSDRGGFTLLRGRRNAMERAMEMVDAARREVVLLGTAGLAADPRSWEDHLLAAARRGARVRVLLPEGDAARGRARRLEGAQVRVLPPTGSPHAGAVLVADGRHAMLVHFLPDDGHPTEGNDTALYADQEGVVAILAMLVEAPWREARPALEEEPRRVVPVEREEDAAGPPARFHPPSH